MLGFGVAGVWVWLCVADEEEGVGWVEGCEEGVAEGVVDELCLGCVVVGCGGYDEEAEDVEEDARVWGLSVALGCGGAATGFLLLAGLRVSSVLHRRLEGGGRFSWLLIGSGGRCSPCVF